MWRLFNGDYPKLNQVVSKNCTQNLVFIEIDGNPKLMKYDFEAEMYFDMQSKKHIDETHWELLARH